MLLVVLNLGLGDRWKSSRENGISKKILLVGDYAKGIDSGNIEVILIGDQLNTEYIEGLEKKIQDIIERKVSFYLASKENQNQHRIILYENK